MRGFDVGGSHKSQQSNYESFGIRSQNRIVNEGVDTTEGTNGSGWGSHDLKLGFEWQDDRSVFTNNGNSGPIYYLDKAGAVDEIRLTDFNTFDSFGSAWTGNDDRDMRRAIYTQSQAVYPQVTNRQKSTNWQARAMGRYQFKYDLAVAVNLRAQSGFPYARVVTASLPNAGTQTFLLEDIKNNRSDTTAILDLRLEKVFTVSHYRLTAMADVFNLLNSNAVTNFFLSNGANFNKIIATLDPRTAQVALRFQF